ncbi:MAG: VWA domain-containing protein [Terracidiphilus sp.]
MSTQTMSPTRCLTPFGLLACLLAALAPACVAAQTQPAPQNQLNQAQNQPPVPTFRVTTSLVFLDVTVLDKKGNPVLTGLTKNDFHITQDKKPQRIFSFEAPQTHVMGPGASDDNPDGKAPVNIIVLDQLNTRFEDFAYIRYEARRFLMQQPALLAAPAELLVIRDQSLEMLQGYTRNRADLVSALDHLPGALPFEEMNAMFVWDRFAQSIDALQQIALQNRGVPGRKNVIWVGHGGPGVFLDTPDFTPQDLQALRDYAHQTTNLLVDSRISLYVIYPGLHVNRSTMSISSMDADIDLGEDDPFGGNINFGLFANATGGKLYFNRNDLDHLIGRSEQLGSEYYTLTYQPSELPFDGKFQRIRVTVKNRDYRVVTKAGYFAPDPHINADPRLQAMANLGEAAISTVPFSALHLGLRSMVRHPDTSTVDMVVQLQDKNLPWLATGDGKSKATMLLEAVSRKQDGQVLASRIEHVRVLTPLPTAAQRASLITPISISVHFPRKAQDLRVVVESEEGGRMGSFDLTRKMVDAAPAEASPSPQLQPRRPAYVPSARPVQLPPA